MNDRCSLPENWFYHIVFNFSFLRALELPTRSYIMNFILYGSIRQVKLDIKTCNHWACNKADNTCVGCGAIICPVCLKEPVNCKCENKDICCTS